ncbi:MAG: associated protein [Candidatus Nomurabacteria bacterium]|nr:associated protein [Candidatus Nomurabacteria bacterium]
MFAFIIKFITTIGYKGIFLLMVLESALIPIPSEVTMPFAGFLVSQGTLLFIGVVIAGALGNVAGSLIGYYLGFWLGEKRVLRLIERYGKFILLSTDDYKKSSTWFQRYGGGVVFFSRLLPGVRTFISLPVGVFKMPIVKFSLYTFIGSLIWSVVLTGIGFYLGANWDAIGPVFSKLHYILIALLLILIGYYVYYKHTKKKQHS